MYIEKIRINEFRVLEDIEVRFQKPGGETADPETGNVVNVVAGVNGTGKTSLLTVILEVLSNAGGLVGVEKRVEVRFGGCDEVEDLSTPAHANKFFVLINKWQTESKNKTVPYKAPQSLFLSSQQNFKYNPKPQLVPSYRWAYRVNVDDVLGNAEFYIKEFVLQRERNSSVSDPQARTKAAIAEFNNIFGDAKLLTKLSDLDGKQFNRPVFSNAQNEIVTIDQLSDGEKQLYGRVIALMIIDPRDSIILIDEPEIALHPAWQQKIMQIYSRIGTNNQFIVATHSPQVIASVPYQNRIILRKQEGKIQPIHCHQPPSGIDVNSILSEVMGAEPISSNVLKLYQKYRSLVEARKESSDEAQAVKQELLEYEGEHSAFMQEMNFLIELRDAA